MSRHYTNEELVGSISKFMRTSIARLSGPTGNRRTDIVFGEVQDAAAGVFLTQANAPYYVVALARDIIVVLIENTIRAVQDLDDTVLSTNRFVKPVQHISALANARSALGSLSAAASDRSTSLTGLTDVPAYRRFEQSTSRFVREYGENIRSNGSVVQTPQEARARLASLVSDMQSAYEEVLSRLRVLSSALEDFDSLNLPAALSSSIIANSREVLSRHFDDLDALSETERLGKLREVILDVLTSRAVLKGFGALNPTTLFLYFAGNGAPYADGTHPAISAELYAEKYGPYVFYGEASLDVVIDGAHALTLQMPQSYVAQIDGYMTEEYTVLASPDPDQNDTLVLRATGLPDAAIILSAGAGRRAQDVADDVNTALGGAHHAEAVAYGPQLYLQEEPLAIISAVGPTTVFERLSGDWGEIAGGFEVQVGDWLQVSDPGQPDNDGWYLVQDIGGLPSSFETARETPGDAVVSTTAVGALNRGGRAVRITFKEAYKAQAIEEGWSLELVASTGSLDAAQRALYTLGLTPNVAFECARTSTEQVVEHINGTPAVVVNGVQVLEAFEDFQSTLYVGPARSVPEDALKVVCARLSGLAEITSSGTSAIFSLVNGESLPAIGEYVAIRGASLNSVLNFGEVTAAGLSTFTALMNTAVVPEVDVQLEVGPNLAIGNTPFQFIVENDPATFNDGSYSVVAVGGLDGAGPPFELGLGRPLPVPAAAGFQVQSLGTVRVGQHRLGLRSKSTLLASRVQVLGSSSAEGAFWATTGQESGAQTVWFALPEAPKQVEAGDVLEFRDTGAQGAFGARIVEATETSPHLLKFTEGVSADFGTYNLAQDAPAPSARLRKVRRDAYDVLKAQLDSWLALPVSDSARYFAALRRKLNPLIANENPTVVAVADASAQVRSLLVHLAEVQVVLAAYSAPIVEQVDRIIATYREQGADRAVDLLLQAKFSQFFNVAQEGASYNGHLQRAIRAVNLNDLPIAKLGRRSNSVLLESYEEQDFEFDTSDTDNVEEFSVPGEAYEYPNSAF